MLLLTATSIVLFFLLQLSSTLQGAVGSALAVTMAVLGAISFLHSIAESSNGKKTGPMSGPFIQGQLKAFMTLPTAFKILIVLVALALPLAIDAIV